MRCNAELPGKGGLQVGDFFAGSSQSRCKGTEAVNPALSGRAPRSSRLRPGFPNWKKSSSSSRRKRTRRTGETEEEEKEAGAEQPPKPTWHGARRGGWASREGVRGGAR